MDAQLRESAIKSIQEAVAEMFGLAVEELSKESGPRDVAVPRYIAMSFCKEMTDASASEIGRYFGGRHSSTVRYAIARVQELRRREPKLDHTLSKLRKTLNDR
jgi:chromosomal replication initiator protein